MDYSIKRTRSLIAKISALLVSIVSSWDAYSTDGNMLVGSGPIQMGTAGAGAASPQDATWTLINPAGIVDLDGRVDLYFHYLDLDRSLRPKSPILPLANPFVGKLNDASDLEFGSFAMTWPLKHGTLGFGIVGTMGNNVDFPQSRTSLALLSNGDRRSRYEVARIPLTYAYRFDNGWSIGASLVGAYTRFQTDTLTIRLRPTVGDNRWDTEFGLGYNLGVYKQWDRWAFSAMYSSPIWVPKYEKYPDVIKHGLNLPQEVRVGVAHDITDRVELMLDYRYINWEGVNQYSNPNLRSGLGWRDQHIVKFGAAWDVNDQWTLRAGAAYGRSAVPEDQGLVNGLFTALAETHIAAGMSYHINDRHDVHLAVEHSLPERIVDNGKGSIFSRLGKGSEVTYYETIWTIGYSYSF